MSRTLIHIGWPKAGSSWLQQWFASHPDVAPRGPLSVISDEALVLPRATGNDAFDAGEAMDRQVLEARQAKVCTQLAQDHPEAHILIVTRGFREMILSSYSQYVRTGGSEPLAATLAHAARVQPWNYDHVLALYRKAFSGRVIVLPFELLAEDPQAFAAELAARIGIAPHAGPTGRINPALTAAELGWYPLLVRKSARWPSLQRRIAAAAFDNRLGALIAVLDHLFPGRALSAEAISAEDLNAFAEQATALADEPLYARYRAQYLACGKPIRR
jgi:hypothetical protein